MLELSIRKLCLGYSKLSLSSGLNMVKKISNFVLSGLLSVKCCLRLEKFQNLISQNHAIMSLHFDIFTRTQKLEPEEKILIKMQSFLIWSYFKVWHRSNESTLIFRGKKNSNELFYVLRVYCPPPTIFLFLK